MRRDIQGLRGVAVLLVVLFHGQLGFSGGFIGVDVFFVISGFVITGVLIRDNSELSTLRQRLSKFYVRRARRLLPALGVVVGVGQRYQSSIISFSFARRLCDVFFFFFRLYHVALTHPIPCVRE